MKSDLHIHTYYSDGVFSPEKIVDTALDVGLDVIALTDHDNVLSYDVAKNHLKSLGKEDNLEIIQGVEINTLYKNYEIHILGYFMDPEDSDFKKLLRKQYLYQLHRRNFRHSFFLSGYCPAGRKSRQQRPHYSGTAECYQQCLSANSKGSRRRSLRQGHGRCRKGIPKDF